MDLQAGRALARSVQSVNHEIRKEKHFPFVILDLIFGIADKLLNVQ